MDALKEVPREDLEGSVISYNKNIMYYTMKNGIKILKRDDGD